LNKGIKGTDPFILYSVFWDKGVCPLYDGKSNIPSTLMGEGLHSPERSRRRVREKNGETPHNKN